MKPYVVPKFYGQPVPRMELKEGTWLDREELAYNTHTGSASRSGRRARAKCFDGKLRTFQVGIPNTFFSIPAIGKIAGKYVRGWVEVKDNVVIFHRQSRYKEKANEQREGSEASSDTLANGLGDAHLSAAGRPM